MGDRWRPMQTNRPESLPVLVVAPYGRDAQLIVQTLRGAKITCETFGDPGAVVPELSNGTGALLLEEEVLNDKLIQEFALALQKQPPWSDPPVIVLTKARKGSDAASKLMAR